MKNNVVGNEITMEDMVKLWSTKDLLGWGESDILSCHHRLNHFTFNLQVPTHIIQEGDNTQEDQQGNKTPPCVAYLFV